MIRQRAVFVKGPRRAAPLLVATATCCLLALPRLAVCAQPPAPCADAVHGQFDFWVGDWQVTTPAGKPAGTSHVERILNGCVIFENWKSAGSSYAGKSFNTYDAMTREWNQVWVDTDGETIHFHGRRAGNVMDMSGVQSTPDGELEFRMSYTLNDDGTVRQLWRQRQGNADWKVLFDGLYRRAQQAGAVQPESRDAGRSP